MERLSYEERFDKTSSPLTRKLLNIITTKMSNLCVAVDFKNFDDILRFIDKAGHLICVLKLHSDLSRIYREDQWELLYKKKKEYNFLIFEDRKLNDVAGTVQGQYEVFVKYADLVTVDPTYGDGLLVGINNAINEADLPAGEPRGCLVLVELSYTLEEINPDKRFEMCRKHPDLCIGMIAQDFRAPTGLDVIKFTPGIHLDKSGDGKTSQRWRSPEKVMASGTDVVIVGRGVTESPEEQWEAVTRQYKEAAYSAYLSQIKDY